MRNPNGYGTIFKLKGNRRRPWVAKIPADWNDKGNPIQKPIGYFEDKKSAMLALAEYHKNPYDIDTANITLAQIYDIFLQRKFMNTEIEKKQKKIIISYVLPIRRLLSI